TASTVEVRKPRLTAVIKSCWDDTRFPSVRSPPRTLATADALTIDITSSFNGDRVRHLALIIPPVAQTSKPQARLNARYNPASNARHLCGFHHGHVCRVVNTVGFGFRPSAAAYAMALTCLLVVGGWVFVQNLGLFFGETPSR